jgi:cell division initiation protein
MAITPVEIHHLELRRGLFGYRRGAVDRALSEIADSYAEVWRQRADLADKVEHLEGELQRHRELESLLRQTLVSAERAAQEQLETARKQAETIVGEAHAEARNVARRAQAERERLEHETQRVRALLRSALAVVDAPQTQPAQPTQPEGEVRRIAG